MHFAQKRLVHSLKPWKIKFKFFYSKNSQIYVFFYTVLEKHCWECRSQQQKSIPLCLSQLTDPLVFYLNSLPFRQPALSVSSFWLPLSLDTMCRFLLIHISHRFFWSFSHLLLFIYCFLFGSVFLSGCPVALVVKVIPHCLESSASIF